MRRRGDIEGQLELSLSAPVEVTPRGDGTFMVKVGKPVAWLWVTDIARQYGISAEAVRRWIREGRLEARRMGLRKWQVSAEAISRFIREQNGLPR